MTKKIGIIDYGVGNIGSIQNMIRRLGGKSDIVQDAQGVLTADKLVLPGVGNFDHGMLMLINNIMNLQKKTFGDYPNNFEKVRLIKILLNKLREKGLYPK